MELRVLQYFLAVTREESISAAANALHLSQPTLSRQLKDMEEELGKQLFIRGSRKISLTEEGSILKQRAEEILDLVRKTENELTVDDKNISGQICIGAGETDGVRFLAKVAKELQKEYPNIQYKISSGDAETVVDQLDKGLIDFGLLLDPVDISRYDYLKIPFQDSWGVLMRRDAPLAEKSAIKAEDLWDKPLIVSRQAIYGDILPGWLKRSPKELNISAIYNLVFNASLLVDEGLGYALCLDKIINPTGDSNLCFRPFEPELKVGMNLVWKKYQVFSKASEKFLNKLRDII